MGPPPRTACGWCGCINGFGWGLYGAPCDIRAINYTEGTLILDVIDRASNQLAWRATSQRRVNDRDAEQTRVDARVMDMTQSLPTAAAR